MQCIPPHIPLLYSKTGVYKGIPIFVIFYPKHRLWVLVRTASLTSSARRLINVLNSNIENINKENQLKFFIFTTKKFLYFAWASFRNDVAISSFCQMLLNSDFGIFSELLRKVQCF